MKDTQIALIEPPTEDKPPEELKAWALVEIFGHTRIVGYLTQQAFGSAVMFRVDVPDLTKDGKVIRKGFTRYFGVGSIYSITPIDEATVRELLPSISGAPARPYSVAARSHDYQSDAEPGW